MTDTLTGAQIRQRRTKGRRDGLTKSEKIELRESNQAYLLGAPLDDIADELQWKYFEEWKAATTEDARQRAALKREMVPDVVGQFDEIKSLLQYKREV